MMDVGSSPDVVVFEQFRFDRRAGTLSQQSKDDGLLAVSVGSRALAILGVLVERAGDLVSRDEIISAVWPGAAVEESNLTVQLSALRRVLDAGRAGGSCIQNIPGRGYRFLPQVRHLNDCAEPLGTRGASGNDGAGRQFPVLQMRGRRWPAIWSMAAVATFAAIMAVVAGYSSRLFSPGTPPPRLSLIVLPFENLSADPKDIYLAEGITEDVTTELSRVPGMFVIARESAYVYQGKSIDVHKVGKELGVRYVVEGSMRRLGDTLRVSARLIATGSAAQLWADRFDQQLSELSAGQDAIVSRIAQTLNVALADIEVARSMRERPTSPDAFDLILRARSLSLHPMGPQEHAERKTLLEHALQLDPKSIYALTQLAFEIDREQVWGSANADDPNRAARLVAQAAAIDPNHIGVLYETAHLSFTNRRYGEAVATLQRVLDEYPNAAWAYYNMAANLIPLGRAAEAVSMLQITLRRDPLNGWNYDRYADMGWALLLLGRDEEAMTWLQRALAASPTDYSAVRAWINVRLAAAYARLGHFDRAHSALVETNRIWPYNTVRNNGPGYPPKPNPVFAAQIEQYQAALRLAGLRDHAEEDADFGLPADGNLRTTLAGFTPKTVPGATTIHTVELEKLLGEQRPIVIDPMAYSGGSSVPGAIGLKDAGRGGSTTDAMQGRLRKKLSELTNGGDLTVPIVVVSWNSEGFGGRNLAIRLVALGYTNVYWYRGGREAWEVAGLPETEIDVQEW